MDPYRVSNANNGHNNGNYNYDRARARSIIGGRRLGDGTLHSNQIPEAKRKHEDELNVLADNESKSAKISTTSSFMSTLYKEGIYSDVCIELTAPHFLANKIMKLHKTIICQSAYFQALFNASWKEANQEVIKIAITDRNITERSIDILFESFYTSTLNYDSNEEDLISLLATARMFTADEVANLCAKELFSIVTMNNVIYSYYSFSSYGFSTEEDQSFEYMLRNFSYWYDQNTESFQKNVMEIMDQPLFEKLVSHDDFIVKDEFMLYELIKKWTVEKLKEREDYDYFRIWERPDHTPFLLTADGDPYVNLFKNVRISNIIMDRSNLEKLKSDNIIPFDWIEDAGATSLAQMMEISNGTVGSDFKSYRVGIFHSDEATIFVDKIVNYHGIYLRFEFTSGIFTVHRFRHGSETMFHHGTCFLQFRITLYTRKGHKYMKECNKVVVIKRYISENETLNLFQGEGEEIRYKFPTMWDFINVVNTEIGDCRSEFRLPTNKLFPTIIGIDLLYLSGPQKKKQLLEE